MVFRPTFRFLESFMSFRVKNGMTFGFSALYIYSPLNRKDRKPSFRPKFRENSCSSFGRHFEKMYTCARNASQSEKLTSNVFVN